MKMESDDYKVSPCGRLGAMTGVSQGGKFLGSFGTTEEALAFVWEHMEEERYWPNVWWVSDHGNAWPIDRNGDEIEIDVSEEDEAEEFEECEAE